MALTGHEKDLTEYTKNELVEIAKNYKIYYRSTSGVGKMGAYQRLTKQQLIDLIKNDYDYIVADPEGNKVRDPNLSIYNKLRFFKKNLTGTETPEYLMNEILSILEGRERPFPIPGKYYTYIYYAVTPKIIYDRHPLILAGNPLPRGFLGYNYHHGRAPRQYNTVDGDRLVSGLYEVMSDEVIILRGVPYAKMLRTS
jgi:hypothetical protein